MCCALSRGLCKARSPGPARPGLVVCGASPPTGPETMSPKRKVAGPAPPVASSYADVREGKPVALIGSEGLIEVAIRNASAAQRMKARIGDAVRLVVTRRP